MTAKQGKKYITVLKVNKIDSMHAGATNVKYGSVDCRSRQRLTYNKSSPLVSNTVGKLM